MALQAELPTVPGPLTRISEKLALASQDGRVTLFNAGGPIFTFGEKDGEARRVAVAMASSMELASPSELAAAFEMHRSMVYAWRERYETGGVAALRTRKTGPKGPHKLEGERLARAQAVLDKGASKQKAADAAGVSEGTIRHALKQGWLRPGAASAGDAPKTPRRRNDEDRGGAAGVAVKRETERMQAMLGLLDEAKPVFPAAESVARAGVLVALPAVVAQGLYEVSQQIYGALRNGFYGLNTVLSTFVFMALLRIRNIEQLPSHAPGEFGLALGLDRAPEIKTLRRKLSELAGRAKALELQGAFAERWAEEQPELLGFLYVDGHVRPYHGRKHRLPKTHVARRRLAMPATTDYWVNDAFADPLFFVTCPGNEGLLAALDAEVLPEVRRLVGEETRVTLILDRESWSPRTFRRWHAQGFDVMTYRKGRYDDWPEASFEAYESQPPVGRPLRYLLAEAPLTLPGGLPVREVRCLTETGHQTSIVTTRSDLSVLEVAERMFSRWRQENFFRYMRHEFDLDHLPAHAVEAADPQRQVPNPEKKRRKKELDALRKQIRALEAEYGAIQLAGEEVSESRQTRLLADLEAAVARLASLEGDYRALPARVAIGEVPGHGPVVQLEAERKMIIDQVKMVAYRAETELANLVAPLLGHYHGDEARVFLRQVFQLPADLIPDERAGVLRVRLHGMANWRSNRALAGLCAILNCYETRYPGTDLQLVLEAPPVSEKIER